MNKYQIHGTVQTEFLLCENRRNCTNCPLQGDLCRRKRREVMLLSDVWYLFPDGRILYIKKGFIFDGASVPRVAWRVIGHPLDHEFIRSALPHDALFAAQLLPKEQADDVFAGVMIDVDNIGWFKRNTMYSSVKVGGGSAWRSHTPKSIANARNYVQIIPAVPVHNSPLSP